MTMRTTPPFRADHVGSFLRPKFLLDAREQRARGEITPAQLRTVEDKAIAEIVEFQQDVGLQSITDGEFRRTTSTSTSWRSWAARRPTSRSPSSGPTAARNWRRR